MGTKRSQVKGIVKMPVSTRARAAEKTDNAVKSTKIITPAAKATRITKRKTRSDDDDKPSSATTNKGEESQPAKATRGRPRKTTTTTKTEPPVEPKTKRVTVSKAEPVTGPRKRVTRDKSEPKIDAKSRVDNATIVVQPSKPTRGRPKKVTVATENTQPEVEEPTSPPPAATRRRATSINDDCQTMGRPTVVKKKVTFDEDRNKENRDPKTSRLPAAKEKPASTGLRAKPVRKPTSKAATTKTATKRGKKAEEAPKDLPLSPKKDKQVATGNAASSDEDELCGPKTPMRFASSLMASPAKRPPTSPMKPFLNTPARRQVSPVKSLAPKSPFEKLFADQLTLASSNEEGSRVPFPAFIDEEVPATINQAVENPRAPSPTLVSGEASTTESQTTENPQTPFPDFVDEEASPTKNETESPRVPFSPLVRDEASPTDNQMEKTPLIPFSPLVRAEEPTPGNRSVNQSVKGSPEEINFFENEMLLRDMDDFVIMEDEDVVMTDAEYPVPATYTPEKPLFRSPRTIHTVSKVPLKPAADEESPSRLPRPRRSSSWSQPRSSQKFNQAPFSPTKTPRPGPEGEILKGAVIHVDVHTNEGADASQIFVDLLTQMGAKCVKHWTWDGKSVTATLPADDSPQKSFASSSTEQRSRRRSSRVGVTHVVFKDGGSRTIERVRASQGAVVCVGVAWVLEWVDESSYGIDTSITPRGGHRRRKSMEPRALSNVNGNVVPSDSSAARRASGEMSPTKEFLDLGSSPIRGANDDALAIAEHDSQTQIEDAEAAGERRRYSSNCSPHQSGGPSPTAPTFLSTPPRLQYQGPPITPTPFFPNKIVQQTCPPKQENRPLFGADVGLQEEATRMGMTQRLLAARRKSLAWAPKVASPLSKQWL
ncbi:MAG: hypothetical protein M1819_003007 [Sarea resinae]|nr:MAG: hypothetical protein M1819_003007 [Sarea resinae]